MIRKQFKKREVFGLLKFLEAHKGDLYDVRVVQEPNNVVTVTVRDVEPVIDRNYKHDRLRKVKRSRGRVPLGNANGNIYQARKKPVLYNRTERELCKAGSSLFALQVEPVEQVMQVSKSERFKQVIKKG